MDCNCFQKSYNTQEFNITHMFSLRTSCNI